MTVLSIGMIVKNEEKRLRATLEALQPLRDAVDCQLIIADTGSDDSTVEIAKEFANVFLEIEWENDFAKARNATLAKAEGIWYFYLDADEVLTDAEELANFLRNPSQWKNYRSISIRLQNLVSEEKNIWQDFTSERFFQIERDKWFVGAIHETYPKRLPVYELKQTYLLHYGYNNDDEDFMRSKGKRNLAIMEAHLQQNVPGGVDGAKLWIDYADSLMLVGDRSEDIIKAIHQAAEQLKPLELDSDVRMVMLARGYSIMMRAVYQLKDYNLCTKMAEEYYDIQPMRGMWDMDIYCIQGWAQMQLEQYEAAIDSLETYLKIAKQPKPRELTRLIIFASDGLEDRAHFFLAQMYAKLRDYDQAWKYLEKIDGSVEGIDITMYRWQMALDNDSDKRLPEVYAKLDEKNRETIFASLPDAICKKDSLRQQNIAAGLRQIMADDEEALLPLLALATNDAEELHDGLRQMGDNKFTTAQGGIIYKCLKLLIPMDELLPHLDKNAITDYISTCRAYYNDWLNWAVSYYDAFDAKEMPLSELWMARHLLCAGIAEETNDPNLRLAIWPMLLQYVGEYLHQVYNPIMLTKQIDLLPAAEQFVVYAQQAEEALAEKNYTQAVQALREALRIYPSTQAVIERKLAEIEDLADPIGAEMKRLAANVKTQIRTLINDGLLDEAETLIDELSAIVPDDADIPSLLEQTQPPDIIWN